MTATPSIWFSPASSSLPVIPPNPLPYTVPPPPASSVGPPFTIPESPYQRLLSANYPITFALVYATTATILNRVNASRGNKPWPFSKTAAFLRFVVLHNVVLAIYSGWTFVGMVKAVHHSVGPSLHGREGMVGVWDAVCKIHGPSGLGNAASYNETTRAWVASSPITKLSASGTPLSTDTGRLWNEGLAFYGWIFYLSKFYEVVDTAIILAKGKRSSTLQMYHHAGAMLCVWAGIRYMAPPIFMFCLFNSCIHTMMYTYYTLTALSFRIPRRVKRTLTTLQIIQFVVGALFASSNLFISYTIPVEVPYAVLKDNISVASSVTAAARFGSFLKKIALHAAGDPRLAGYIAYAAPQQHQKPIGYMGSSVYETRPHTEYQTVPCLSTSGEVFAIWLNVIYLAPLTWLFVRFFIRSYIRHTLSITKQISPRIMEKATRDAVHGVNGELNGGAFTYANGNTKVNRHAKTNGHTETHKHANGTAKKD